MRDKAGFVQQICQEYSEHDQSRTDCAAACHLHAQILFHSRRADEKEDDQLRQICCFCFFPALQETLDDIGLDFHAIHLCALVDGCKICILQRRCIWSYENDLACPVISRYLPAQKRSNRNTVIVGARMSCVRNVKMTACSGFWKQRFQPLLFQIGTDSLIGQRIYSIVFLSVRIHIQKPMPQHAVHIHHGIDMPLLCAVSQSLIRLFISDHSRRIYFRRPSVLPCDLFAELCHRGCDHISEAAGRLCQPLICLFRAVSRIENIDSGNCGSFIGVFSQCFKCGSNNVPVPGIVRPQQIKCLVIDPNNNDIRGCHSGMLKEPVLHPSVHPL